MSTSPRARTKPRKSKGDVSAQPPVDSTPDHIFIKLYPARLRALIEDLGLVRVEVAALLLLAARMDENRQCYPGRGRQTNDQSYTSGRWTARLIERLESKGAIIVDRSHNQSNVYTLPNVFDFGKHDSVPGGVRNSVHDVPNSVPEQDSMLKPNTSKKNESSRSTLTSELIAVGVKAKEAELIANQYSTALVKQVIAEATQRAADIANPGAWVRQTVEIRAKQKIRYTNSKESSNATATPPVPAHPPKRRG